MAMVGSLGMTGMMGVQQLGIAGLSPGDFLVVIEPPGGAHWLCLGWSA